VNELNYVPILKSKEGELIALRNLTPETKARMIPLIELQPRETSKLLSRTLGNIKKGWIKELPLFLDVDKAFLSHDEQSAIQILSDSLSELAKLGFKVVPVTGLGRSAEFNNAVHSFIGYGVCIRLVSADWRDLATLESRLRETIQGFSLPLNQVDLVFDYEAFLPSSLGTIITSAVTAMNGITSINRYRNSIFVATAFPSQPISQPYTVYHYPRSEYDAWSTLISVPNLKRKPIFGDYTTVHPVLPDLPFQVGIKIAPKIKYATNADWICLKWDAGDFDRFHEVCSNLAALPEFKGADYSWGDSRIAQCSATRTRTGNPREWVSIGINHHLTLVAEQCANHPDA